MRGSELAVVAEFKMHLRQATAYHDSVPGEGDGADKRSPTVWRSAARAAIGIHKSLQASKMRPIL
jgi:hypothetical protein